MANEEKSLSDRDTSKGCQYASAADVFENDIVQRKIFNYLSLTDLLSLTLVNSSLCQKARRFIAKNRTCNINIPKTLSPCRALVALESQLEQMEELPFTGLNIYLNDCKSHQDPCHNVEEEFPNIFNRLSLKRLRVHYIFRQPIICWKTAELVAKCLEKSAMVIEELDMKTPEWTGETGEMPRYLHGSNVYPRVKTISTHCYLFWKEELLAPLVVACPNVQQISFADERLIPSDVYHLVNKVHLSDQHWPELKVFRSFIQKKSPVLFLKTSNKRFQEFAWASNYELAMEYLMQAAQDSLQTLVMHGEEFFRWSNFSIPTMKNLKKIQIVQPLKQSLFFTEFCHLCKLMPNLQVVHLKHHQSWNLFDDEAFMETVDDIKPNLSTGVLRIEEFQLEMDILMESFVKLFPNLKELHVFDCDSSVLDWIFEWPQLECLVLGREHSHWTENFDHIMLGVTLEELEEMKSGRVIVPCKPSLLSLRCLRRLYVIGGPFKTDDAFLSPWAMSVIMKWMPNLAVRILRGFKRSILEDLLQFDNFSQHLVYPSCPYDINQLFCS